MFSTSRVFELKRLELTNFEAREKIRTRLSEAKTRKLLTNQRIIDFNILE